MAMVAVDTSSLFRWTCAAQVAWRFQLILLSSNKLIELLQWFCYDDSIVSMLLLKIVSGVFVYRCSEDYGGAGRSESAGERSGDAVLPRLRSSDTGRVLAPSRAPDHRQPSALHGRDRPAGRRGGAPSRTGQASPGRKPLRVRCRERRWRPGDRDCPARDLPRRTRWEKPPFKTYLYYLLCCGLVL